MNMSPFLSNPWFAALSESDRRALMAAATPVLLRRGGVLLRKGDAPDGPCGSFFGVERGHLKASVVDANGREFILSKVEPGQWFGEPSLLDGTPRRLDVTAMAESTVHVVQAAPFNALMDSNSFARAIARLTATRLRLHYRWMEDLIFLAPRQRIASRLRLLAREDAAQLPLPRLRIAISQETLAMMLGLTRQTLNRELKKLAAEGLIALGRGHIDVLDRAWLRTAG